MEIPVALADGSWEMLAFMAIMFFGVVYGYYTIKGSGISQHPHGKIYSGAPGAKAPSNASSRDEAQRMSDWSRGTR
jgi:hypothetical protein